MTKKRRRKRRKKRVSKRTRKKMNNDQLKDFLIHDMSEKEKSLKDIDEAIEYFEKKGNK